MVSGLGLPDHPETLTRIAGEVGEQSITPVPAAPRPLAVGMAYIPHGAPVA